MITTTTSHDTAKATAENYFNEIDHITRIRYLRLTTSTNQLVDWDVICKLVLELGSIKAGALYLSPAVR
jgi:hypothetical protein